MKQKHLYIAFITVFFSSFVFAQHKERAVLAGRVVSDSLEVENITVFNLSSNVSAITNTDGKFSIKARETDTLYFQSLSFVSKKYILTERDFWVEELEIRLDVKVNELNEVVVSPSTLTGNLKADTKKIKVYGPDLSGIDMSVKKVYSDSRFDQTPNSVMTSPLAPNGSNFNFLLIFKAIGNLLGIKGDPKKYSEKVYENRWQREVMAKSFSDHLYSRFSHNFFISNLNLKNEEINDFIAYADPGYEKLAFYLKNENELAFVEYLIQKVDAFKRNKKVEKNTNTE